MELAITNAREFGLRLGSLCLSEIDRALAPAQDFATLHHRLREATTEYAAYFNATTQLDQVRGGDALSVLQNAIEYFHRTAEHIAIFHGARAANVFRTSFLATFFVRASKAGMPPEMQESFRSHIRESASALSVPSDAIEAFLSDLSPENLFVFVGKIGVQGEALPPQHDGTSTDVFVSYAGEDREEVARPLAEELEARGLVVWFDSWELRVGDSLRRRIDEGLARARYGVVIISPHFLRKEWPQRELDGLMVREVKGRKVILPVWHKMDAETLAQYSPVLADRFAASTEAGITRVADLLIRAMT
ncbi:MAG: toll/interleukin-1 receptor domain-containing protein [Armatimonadetes bacterium]|nr:toll/interleukin-1 receptor domain-containing protein [Armatimonadota bacterium]